jgi:ferredoxin
MCVLPQPIFSSLDGPTDEEEDCLDLAPGLSETSRLGCQVVVHDGFEGAVIDLPANTVNFYVDGFVPNQH